MKQLYDINSLASVLSVPPSDIFRIEISEVNRVLPGQIGDRYYCVIKPDRFICYYLKKGIINNQVSLLFKDFQEAKFYCKRGKLYFESNFKGYFFDEKQNKAGGYFGSCICSDLYIIWFYHWLA